MSVQFPPKSTTTATPPTTGQPSILFGQRQSESASSSDEFKPKNDTSAKAENSLKERFMQRLQHAFSKEGLKRDTKWAIAFAVAGLILPGSQLLLVPAAYAMGITLRFLQEQ